MITYSNSGCKLFEIKLMIIWHEVFYLDIFS